MGQGAGCMELESKNRNLICEICGKIRIRTYSDKDSEALSSTE